MQTHWFNIHDVTVLLTAAFALLLAVPLGLLRRRGSSDLAQAGFLLTQGLQSICFVLFYSAVFQAATFAALAPFQAHCRRDADAVSGERRVESGPRSTGLPVSYG